MNKRVWDLYAPLYEKFMRMDERIYAFMYRRIPKVVKGRTVLEVATGPGLLARHIAPYTACMVATDYSEGMIREAQKAAAGENACPQLRFEVADAAALPYEDASFDVVIISNALHVMDHPEQALDEASRVLKENGVLIAPNYVHGRLTMREKAWSKVLSMAGIDFRHQWTPEEYRAFLEANGWEVVNACVLDAFIPLAYTESRKKDMHLPASMHDISRTGMMPWYERGRIWRRAGRHMGSGRRHAAWKKRKTDFMIHQELLKTTKGNP